MLNNSRPWAIYHMALSLMSYKTHDRGFIKNKVRNWNGRKHFASFDFCFLPFRQNRAFVDGEMFESDAGASALSGQGIYFV